MNRDTECPVCGSESKKSNSTGAYYFYDCVRCSDYTVTMTAMPFFSGLNTRTRAKLSGWIFDQNQLGSAPTIDSKTFEYIAQLRELTFMEKGERLLAYCIKQSPTLGTELNFDDPKYIAAISGVDASELEFVIKHLSEMFYLRQAYGGNLTVAAAGYIHAEQYLNKTDSLQAFVAMWFDPSLQPVYTQGIESAIEAAGYHAMRIDKKEHSNKIDDEIIAEIRRSRFLVADFTGHRAGVYFEAGFAMGLGLPVIWTCRKDAMHELHFDIRQYNCIDWIDEEDLKTRLFNRIGALIGSINVRSS